MPLNTSPLLASIIAQNNPALAAALRGGAALPLDQQQAMAQQGFDAPQQPAPDDATAAVAAPSYDEQASALKRRMALAEQLRGAKAPTETQMVSGRAVPNSPWVGLGAIAQQLLGGYEQGQADKRQAVLDASSREAKIAALKGLDFANPESAYKAAGNQMLSGEDSNALLAFGPQISQAVVKRQYDTEANALKRQQELEDRAAEQAFQVRLKGMRAPEARPEKIREFEAYSKMSPEQKAQYESLYGKPGSTSKPMPPTVLKMYNTSNEARANAESTFKLIDNAEALFKDRKDEQGNPLKPVDVSLTARAYRGIARKTGGGDANTQALGELDRLREKLRGQYLLLAKGVQTEGDAKRALDMMMPDTNDPVEIQQQLRDVRSAAQALSDQHNLSVENIEAEYGSPGGKKSAPEEQPAMPSAAPKKNRTYNPATGKIE